MDQMHLVKPLALAAALAFVVAACDGDDPTEEPTQPPAPEPTAAAEPTQAAAEPTATAEPTQAAAAAVTPEIAAGAPAVLGEPRPAPELAGLVNPDGTTFDLAAFTGANTLLFFGYTHCPDVCPATIGELFGVFKESPETQAVFVSVDPERDTPEFLEEWTAYFPPNFNAVTGSPGAIRRAADNYGAKYARVETTSTSGYTMSHTADLYLIDENGQLLLAYPFGTPAAEIVEDLTKLNAG